MTGRDLIIYILENNLENEPVYKDGRLLGFITVTEAAVKFKVGQSTIKALVEKGRLRGIEIGGELYIPVNEKWLITGNKVSNI